MHDPLRHGTSWNGRAAVHLLSSVRCRDWGRPRPFVDVGATFPQSAGVVSGSRVPGESPCTARFASVPAYPFILAVPEPVDLAFITVPVGMALDAVRECIGKGVRGLVVITAGFSETGEAGRELQSELRDMVRAAGIRMVGPNCFGVFNTDPTIRLQGTFAGATTPRATSASARRAARWASSSRIISGSGAWAPPPSHPSAIRPTSARMICSPTGGMIRRRNVILLYLESFSDPAEFLRLAREISSHKPIVTLKGGPHGRRCAGGGKPHGGAGRSEPRVGSVA
jgi:acetate---CoA ligase (ADP-forming)